jgi:regulator of extracellular matrix RemA (YlzA/DUF370 family)
MLIHVGFNNFIPADQIVAILDYKVRAIKKIIKLVELERPTAILNLTKGRRAFTLIVLTANRYIISAIPVITIVKRYKKELNIEEDIIEEKTNKKTAWVKESDTSTPPN